MEVVIGKHIVLIDESDLDVLELYNWYVFYNGYNYYVATKLPNKKHLYLHRVILNLTDPKIQGDHINGNTLDNQRGNLRITNNQLNSMNKSKPIRNTSGYKGVSYYPNERRNKKYLARIGFNYKLLNLGWFSTAEDAAKAYDKSALELYGEFAKGNFI